MNRLLHHAAFAAGLLALAWVGAGYVPGNPLALALVALIGAFYLAGAFELLRFQRATRLLADTLVATKEPPAALGPWLAGLPAGLRDAVRLRIEGERVALPGPALAPTLAGLLVLLGMLGTFLGMVVTLKGTGLALEQASDVDAIRASLAAPVKGLGLAFGTSVAGVAASAMLGLMAALARRERQRAARQLDACIATTLRGHSRAHQRDEALRLLQVQAEAMPALVAQLQALVVQVERQGAALYERLLASQDRFQGEAQRAYAGLAESVDRSLKASLADAAHAAGAAIEPAVQATLAGLAREHAALQATLGAAVQQQIEGTGARLDAGLARLAQAFEQRAAALLDGVAEAHAALDARAGARAEAQLRATASALVELRAALGDSLVRDNAALEERQRLLAALGGLLDTLGRAGSEQRAAIDALVRAAGELLERAGARHAAAVEAGSLGLQSAAAQATASAAELASLGEGFGVAVQLFGRSSEQLGAQLQRIEAALGQSLARSDEQLAYYVAQAREIIDLTLGAQRQVVEELRQVARAVEPAEAA